MLSIEHSKSSNKKMFNKQFSTLNVQVKVGEVKYTFPTLFLPNDNKCTSPFALKRLPNANVK